MSTATRVPAQVDDISEAVIAVDADCPACGWPERTYNTGSRRFGCIRCTHSSDERNA